MATSPLRTRHPGGVTGGREQRERPGTAPGNAAARATAWRRPSALVVGLITGVLVLAGLLVRNSDLFRVAIPEVGDAAANSLLVDDAKGLHLLVGHYSRVGFNHPGPGFMYLQAAGEALFTDRLGVTPAPFNGQAVALLLLASAVVGAVVGVMHSWTRRTSVSVVVLAVALVWLASHNGLAAWWIPYVVVGLFLLLLVAAASVGAGHGEHLPVLAAVGGLLIHGHVSFALFVPSLVLLALAGLVRTTGGPARTWRTYRRPLIVAVAVAALFALPIVLNTLLHWPGEIPKYLRYRDTTGAHDTTLPAALHYARQFWAPSRPWARYVPPLLVVVAAAAAFFARRPLRRPLAALVASAVVAEALVVLYALVGIDDLSQSYIGAFSTSIPLALLLVITVSAADRLAQAAPLRVALAVGGLVGTLAVLNAAPLRMPPAGSSDLPQAVAAVERSTGRRSVVLDIGPGTGPFSIGTGMLLQLERDGRPACVLNETFRVQVTKQRMCTTGEAGRGVRVVLREPGALPAPVARTGLSDIAIAP